MKTYLKSLKRQDGFTLVELMVVVAIIGLLSAVAIPNFKKYQAKAKMSEAKLQLSSAYTAEAAFYSDYAMYSTCLAYMGFDPSPEAPSRYYAIGFASTVAVDANALSSAANSGLNTTAAGCPSNATSTANQTWFAAGKGVGSAIANAITWLPATAVNGTQVDTDNMTFIIGATGVIDGSRIQNTDASQLTINHQKVVQTIRNGF